MRENKAFTKNQLSCEREVTINRPTDLLNSNTNKLKSTLIFLNQIYNKMKLYILLLPVIYVLALDNGLGRIPPMGWNSWNKFKCNINETLIKQTVDLLVSSGLAAKGYKYVNLDDCWQIDRNKTTNEIIEDKTKFP